MMLNFLNLVRLIFWKHNNCFFANIFLLNFFFPTSVIEKHRLEKKLWLFLQPSKWLKFMFEFYQFVLKYVVEI